MKKLTSHATPRPRLLRTCCLSSVLLNALIAPGQAEEAPTPGALQPERDPLSWGPIDLFPRARATMFYDDNIFISPDNEVDDLVWTLSPGIRLAAGDYSVMEESYAAIDYDPTFVFFTQHGDENAIDHDAKLDLKWRPAKWTLGLQQTFVDYSGISIDVGDRVDRSLYNTGLQVEYEISPKTSVQLVGTQSINDYDEGATSYNEWTAGGWLDYWLAPKLRVGAGVTAGWLDVRNAVNQTYQQFLMRLSYQLTGKLDLRASGGLEVRQFQDDAEDSRLNPVFSIGTTYRPGERTEIRVDAYRRTQTSVVLQNQNYTTTGFRATLRQEFLQRLSASLTGGYDHLEYEATTEATTATRADDDFFIRLGLDWTRDDRLVIGVYYQFRDNNSTLDNYTFQDNQVGLQGSYQF